MRSKSFLIVSIQILTPWCGFTGNEIAPTVSTEEYPINESSNVIVMLMQVVKAISLSSPLAEPIKYILDMDGQK